MQALHNKQVLIFAIHRTIGWWRYLGENLGCLRFTIVTDLRGEGDISVVDRFYQHLKKYNRKESGEFELLSETQIVDIIARCRVLRWLKETRARNIIKAMATALNETIEAGKPDIIVSLPIDRYTTDILDRLAQARGIPYVQLTASVLPGMSMLMQRGRGVLAEETPSDAVIQQHENTLIQPSFLPSYIPESAHFTVARFMKTLAYFKIRGWAFKGISYLKRDRLNLHYLDAQSWLGHKCQWQDIRIFSRLNPQWQEAMAAFPKEKRILFGLQLFPEASIDYWIESIDLIEHEKVILAAAEAFSKAGFLIVVKDHPLQFGFRQTQLIDRLLEIPNVVMVPYGVSGQHLLACVDSNFTCTGTLGLQASLLGKTSIVTDSYYTNQDDFVIFRHFSDIGQLPMRAKQAQQGTYDLFARRQRLLRQLICSSFSGDLFSFKGFSLKRPTQAAAVLGQSLGKRLEAILI